MSTLRMGLAQINPTVGDFGGNMSKILQVLEEARALGADIVSFGELVLCGYPPEDLLFKPQFVQATRSALDKIIPATSGITAVVGFAEEDGGKIYNSAAIIHNGELAGIYRKMFLPNYGVFDEKRYFQPGKNPCIFDIDGLIFGVNICEDIWEQTGPTKLQALSGASLIFNLSASPYHKGKGRQREAMLAERAREAKVFIAYTNIVGGQDELVFDGGSLILSPEGEALARGKQFDEDLIYADLETPKMSQAEVNTKVKKTKLAPLGKSKEKPPLPQKETEILHGEAEIYAALILGTRDYVRKNGFQKVLMGLSGGIDSSLTACIARDALGPENVTAVMMPSRYSSRESIEGAREVAKNLGIKLINIPIEESFKAYKETLADAFKDSEEDVTEENLQARIRGNILMALSNKFGWLVLTTGNKSEVSVGYCTLYGDTAGGFALLKDVPKTLVYRLAQYKNQNSPRDVIPQNIISRPPTAELRPQQKDSDMLPEYAILDAILEAYVEKNLSLEEIVGRGHEREVVSKVIQMVDGNEYKRRQGPPGIKITPRAFGRDRRMPITNRFREA